MSHSDHTDSSLLELLDAITEAMLHERDDEIEAQIRQSRVKREEIGDTVALIMRLRSVLVVQQPSDKFVRKLRQDLGGVEYNVVNRLRYMPARVHIAAGLTLLAGGLMLVTRRRGGDENDAITADLPILQQQ